MHSARRTCSVRSPAAVYKRSLAVQPEHQTEVEASSWIRDIKHRAHTVCVVQFATIVGLEGALFVRPHVLQLGATALPPVRRLQPRQGRVVVRTRHRRHFLDRLVLVSIRSNGRPDHAPPPGWVGQAGQKAPLTVEVFIVIRLTSLRVLLGVLRILLRVIKLELAASRCAPVRSTALRQPGRNPARFGLRLGAGRRVGYSAGVPAFRNKKAAVTFLSDRCHALRTTWTAHCYRVPQSTAHCKPAVQDIYMHLSPLPTDTQCCKAGAHRFGEADAPVSTNSW